jgi:hypothetical protein
VCFWLWFGFFVLSVGVAIFGLPQGCFGGVLLFYVCNVFRGLFGCGVGVFLHTPCMAPCWVGFPVRVNKHANPKNLTQTSQTNKKQESTKLLKQRRSQQKLVIIR